VARAFQKRGAETLEGGDRLVEERNAGPNWEWLETRRTLIKDGITREASLRVYVYSGPELRDQLLAAGYRTAELFADWTGSAYDDRARRLIVVARK